MCLDGNNEMAVTSVALRDFPQSEGRGPEWAVTKK